MQGAADQTQGSATLGQDLTACDREPIHVPGAIQPHGLLLIAQASTLSVVAGAGDLETMLRPDWLGSDLSTLLQQDVQALLAHSDVGLGGTVWLKTVRLPAGLYDASLHRSNELLLVELEPAPQAPRSAGDVLAMLDGAATDFERSGDLAQLCDRAAVAFRRLTGFDRVMIYRFLDDDAGVVLAEDRAAGLNSFLNHHFPASDIPRQARALYVRNRVRVIPDSHYDPAVIRSAGVGHQLTDLSDVAIRSVSPLHLQYLRNMGVRASASISIVRDGVLWGLVACHHNSPRLLDRELRAAARALAGGLARQIRAQEEAETHRERLRLRAAEDLLLLRLDSSIALHDALTGARQDMAALLDADGFALVCGTRVARQGHTPDDETLVALARWAAARTDDVFVTRELASVYPEAEPFGAIGSGLLALRLDGDEGFAVWFRAEQVEQVKWAGNPHKAVVETPQAALTPRASFESWAQIVRGRSRRWTLEEVEAARRLRRLVHELRQSRRLRDLNRQLSAANEAQERLLRQKDMLMHEVNHRVQNSIQLVSAFLGMQARASGDAVLRSHLTEAQARLSAVALVHRRLYRDDQVQTVDLGRYLEELIGDIRLSLGDGWGSQLRADLAPVLVPTGRAINIGLVLTELVINATKYAYPEGFGTIDVTLEQHRATLRLIVADHGGGKKATAAGFGSRMMDALVHQLGGSLLFEDNGPGLRAILAAPIDEMPV